MKWIKSSLSLIRGKQAEDNARIYLESKGLKWICSNYRCRSGEIDIIMQEQNTWVFVEVKYRSQQHYGSAVDYFHSGKRKKCLSALQHFMLEQRLNPALVDHRIDLVAIDGDQIQWFQAV